MEQPEGLHGRERGSFIWVVRDERERMLEIRIFYVVRKPWDLVS
jgi:hypothetical protein